MDHAACRGAGAAPCRGARRLVPLFAALLAACGGGGSDTAGSASDATTASASARRTALATTTWTQIAMENQSFTLSATQTVRYGSALYGWVQKTLSGTGQCSNAFFGIDPAPGVGKVCEAAATTLPLLVAPGAWSVIGSSTAAGVGASADHGWVDL